MMGRAAQGPDAAAVSLSAIAEYKGSGDLKDAANWACKAADTRK